MARKIEDKKSQSNGVLDISTAVRWFETSEDSTIDSRKLSERDIDYFDGKQLTAEEIATLRKRKQPTVVNNRIKPKVDYLLGEEIKMRTDPKAFPRNPQIDEESANAATDAIRYVCDTTKFSKVRSSAYFDLLVPGACGAQVIVKPKGRDYDIQVKHIPWDRMFWDPHSRAKDFSDAKYKGIVIWMDKEDALDMFPGKEADLSSVMESVSKSDTYDDKPLNRWADPKRNRVRIVQMEFMRGEECYYCYFTKSGFLRGPEKSPYVDSYGVPCPSIEFQSAFVDRDGNRYGQVRQYIDMQDEINKRRSKGLHLLNTRQVIAEKGAVDNVAQARNEMAKPDGYVEVTPNMKFDVVATQDMAAGNFQMLQEAKMEIDAQGPNAALTGAEKRDLSGRAIQSLQQGSSVETVNLIDGLRDWQHRIYRHIWDRIRQYWTEEKWVRVTDDEKNVRFVGLNQKVPAGQMLLQQMQQAGEQVTPEIEQMVMMDPRAQEMTTVNDVAQLDVDIILEDVPDTVAIQQEQFEQLVSIYPSVPPPMQPIAFEMLVEASSLRNKKQFLERLKGGGQQQDPAIVEQQRQMEAIHMDLQMRSAEAKINKDNAAAMRDMAQAEATVNPPADTPEEMAMQRNV